MSAVLCTNCGFAMEDTSLTCARCGCPARAQTAVPAQSGQEEVPAAYASRFLPQTYPQPSEQQVAALYPLYPVPLAKFIVLSVCTFGLYKIYWSYKCWQRITAATGEGLSPFWRAFFGGLFNFSLFPRVAEMAEVRGIPAGWPARMLAACYLAVAACWRLPNPLGLISLLSFLPYVPVVIAAAKLNATYSGHVSEDSNEAFSGGNIAIIVVGGLLVLLSIVGSFLGPAKPA